jgi:DNA-binding PadR family transcriptional regulator
VACLYPKLLPCSEEQRRASARVTRLLRLLRAHGLIRKITGAHRYRLTRRGREIITAVLRYQSATLQPLRSRVRISNRGNPPALPEDPQSLTDTGVT